MGLDALAVVVDDLAEGFEAAVVHVGGRQGNVAEEGHLEDTVLLDLAGDGAHALVGVAFVQTVVGYAEVGLRQAFAVAGGTVVVEEVHATDFAFGEAVGGAVSGYLVAQLVKTGVHGADGGGELLQGQGDAVGRQVGGAVGLHAQDLVHA